MPKKRRTNLLGGPAKILAAKTRTRKPTRQDLFIRLTQGDLEALAIGMGLMAWNIEEVQDIRSALVKLNRRGREVGVSTTSLPWKYETITPGARLALQLYATGLFPLVEAVHHTHAGLSSTKARGMARALLRKVQERHPATVRAMEEGFLSMKAPLEQLADSRLEAAQESLNYLRQCLGDAGIDPVERVKIAQDFLDRTPETAKVSKTDNRNTQVGGLQMPAEAAARLAEAANRASRYLVRSPEELLHASRGTDLHALPEADARPVPPLLNAGTAGMVDSDDAPSPRPPGDVEADL